MIESLNSPHIARVKALIGSRGTKERKSSGHFVAEGLQCAREALVASSGPRVETLYLTPSARTKVEQIADLTSLNIVGVSDEVMKAMSETITPQGILAVCSIPTNSLNSIVLNGTRRFVYLSEIQDPGNAGTIIREVSKHIQGGGGGQPFFATAGGKNPDGIDNALKAVKSYIE